MIVLVGFTEVVVLVVREVLLGAEVVLTDGIQAHVVKACGVVAQHFQCRAILGAAGALRDMYFCRQVHKDPCLPINSLKNQKKD